jgi:hypothetical protein
MGVGDDFGIRIRVHSRMSGRWPTRRETVLRFLQQLRMLPGRRPPVAGRLGSARL